MALHKAWVGQLALMGCSGGEVFLRLERMILITGEVGVHIHEILRVQVSQVSLRALLEKSSEILCYVALDYVITVLEM